MKRFAIRSRVSGAAFAALLGLAGSAQAQFAIPGFELVYTAPRETTLQNPDLRGPAEVWSEMFDRARHEIVLGQFYVASQPGEALEGVLAHLEAAARRGVKIRFLVEAKGPSDPATLARLRAMPNLALRQFEFGKLQGGIIHAKYLIVDAQEAYVGSQNFDWRSLSHIHETGLKITDARICAQLQAIFEQDWQAQASIAQGRAVAPPGGAALAAPLGDAALAAPVHATAPAGSAGAAPADGTAAAQDGAAYLVASPRAFNPPGVGDSQAELPALLAQAQTEVRVQLLDYAPLDYGPRHTRPYYAVIDNALRAAAARGVKIKLMVSNWNTEAPAIDYLKSLALVPGVEIRIVTLPQAQAGFIPFARVIHTKTMTIDGTLAWVGTSNWSGGYLNNSRNLEVVLRDARMAQRLVALHEQAWSSAYAQPLDVLRVYPKPAKGAPE